MEAFTVWWRAEDKFWILVLKLRELADRTSVG